MFSSTASYNTSNSVEAPQCPNDGISCLAWFPVSQNNQTYLAASSWDQSVRMWEVKHEGTMSCQLFPKAIFQQDAPILTCRFSRQNVLFSGACDGVIKMHNLATNQSEVVGKHDAPVSSVFFDEQKNICISGSWDQTVRFWDCRQPTPAYKINLGVKVYAMDYLSPVLVIAGSDRNVHVVSMMNPHSAPTKIETTLRMQLRCIKLHSDRKFFALSSIEGRTAIVYLDQSMRTNNFAFKAHRLEERGSTKIFPVNAIDFHPTYHNTLLTSGSDGTMVTWDLVKRIKIFQFDSVKYPVNSALFDASGELMAYAVSYDWHKGYAYSAPNQSPNKVLVHRLKPENIQR